MCFILHFQINGKIVLKSGTDFREMSKVTLTFDANMNAKVDIEKIEITSKIPEDEDVKKIVDDNKSKSPLMLLYMGSFIL